MKLSSLLLEIFDDPYKYKANFETEFDPDYYDINSDTTGPKDVLISPQTVEFKTEDNVEYMWYAKQNDFDDTVWYIAF